MITTNAVHQECDYGSQEIAALPSHVCSSEEAWEEK